MLTDLVEESSDPFHTPRHRLVTTGGVLDEDGDFGVDRVESLPPAVDPLFLWTVAGHMPAMHDHGQRAHLGGRIAGVLKDLPRRDPDPVVVGADVDQIGGVDVDRDRGTT